MSTFDINSISQKQKKLFFGIAGPVLLFDSLKLKKQDPRKNSNSNNNSFLTNNSTNSNDQDNENNDIDPEHLQNIQSKTHNIYEFFQKFVIRIENPYKSIWDIFILILICYSCITSAYYVAFCLPTNSSIITFENVVEICFAIDIILRFFHEYRNSINHECVHDIRRIIKNYIQGWFIIDFLAVFPFDIMLSSGNVTWIKLVRLFRLPKFMRLLDESRFDQMLANILENHSREKKMNYLNAAKYVYRITKLVLIATILTYFMGCFWYHIATNPYINPGPNTFNTQYNLDSYENHRRLIICCYFTLTTLATVGYGDYTPQSNIEKIIGILIMILGIALFSYIMGSFNQVLINYDKQMGKVNKNADLQVWLASLSKFDISNPLPKELMIKIDDHFKYYWKYDRLNAIKPDDTFLKLMPENIKHNLIRYLFDDIFMLFKNFLLINDFKNSSFHYDIAFQLLPRKYDPEEMILRQGEVVHEIYLIKEGAIHIYFEYQGQKIGRYFGRGYYFGNDNIFTNTPAQFYYKAFNASEIFQPTKVFAISKQKLLNLLKNYPEIYTRMVENAKLNSKLLHNVLKNELKTKIQVYNPNIKDNDVDEIFNTQVLNRIKLQANQMNDTRHSANTIIFPDVNPTRILSNSTINKLNEATKTDFYDAIDRLHKLRENIVKSKKKK